MLRGNVREEQDGVHNGLRGEYYFYEWIAKRIEAGQIDQTDRINKRDRAEAGQL